MADQEIENLVLGVPRCGALKCDSGQHLATAAVEGNGALSGWVEMRNRLIGGDGAQMLYVFDCCEASIRSIPHLRRDPMKAEDIDTESVDHAADETRYACMARPWLKGPSLEERIKALPIDYLQKQESIGTSEWEKHWKAYL